MAENKNDITFTILSNEWLNLKNDLSNIPRL